MSLFGKSIPKEITSKHTGISPQVREELFKGYMKEKAKEAPINILKATVASASMGGILAHIAEDAIKAKIKELALSKSTGIATKAQKMAIEILGKILPKAVTSKSKVVALLAGLGAMYGLNKAMKSSREQGRAKKIKGDEAKLRRELALRLSEMA